MSAPLVPALNPSGVNRDTIVEMKLAGVYTPFAGVKNFDPTGDESNMQDDTRYSDGGYGRDNKTGTKWSATLMVAWASTVLDPTVYDPCLQYILDNCEGALGVAAQIDVRWYEYAPAVNTPRLYARQGLALATVKVPGGDPNGNKEATITLAGQGKLNKISHPYPQAASVPVIGSVTPSTGTTFATAGGTGFRILGAHFTGTTGVTFGGTAVTSFILWSDGEITGVANAKTAGNQSVVVTNAAGASTGFTVVYA